MEKTMREEISDNRDRGEDRRQQRIHGALKVSLFATMVGVLSAGAFHLYAAYYPEGAVASLPQTMAALPQKMAAAFSPKIPKLFSPQITQSPVEQAGAQIAAESECLAEAMYYEARGEGADGQKAVAEVVLARTRDRNFPGSICGVVYQGAKKKSGCQFSFACSDSAKKPKSAGAWREVELLASKIMNGQIALDAGIADAIYFHAANVSPAWANLYEQVKQVGNHIFYSRKLRPTADDEVADDEAASDESTSDAVNGAEVTDSAIAGNAEAALRPSY
jgi:spore germination cell wall hydrolase CwlJ-like protein